MFILHYAAVHSIPFNSRLFMLEMIYNSIYYSIWASTELTYQNSHLESFLKDISDILFLDKD